MPVAKDSIVPITTNTTAFSAEKKELGVFQNHELSLKNDQAVISTDFTTDWMTLVLLGLLILFTWFKTYFYRMFIQLCNAFLSMAATNQIVRDESVLLQRASLNSSVLSYLIGGLFLYQVSVVMNWQHPMLNTGFLRFITFSLLIALVYSLKMMGLRFLSNIFNAEKPAATYIFTIFLFNMMAGLILFPFIVGMAYLPGDYRMVVLKIACLLLIMIFVYRLVRVVIIWLTIQRASLFYLFLYLCAFEVVPLLLIRKIAMIQV